MKKILIDFEYDQERQVMHRLAGELSSLAAEFVDERGFSAGRVRSSFPEEEDLEAGHRLDEFNRLMADLELEEMGLVLPGVSLP